ncbi:MAG: EAL domain-containing protein, partial [Erysipelotrichaceae bacterium]|nr:EAL domain-containing protein [Erysipelotrichaceae bacterium]
MIGCRKLGIDMALDDFGTGYSSINMLLKYPFRIIKLARELIVESTASMENSNPSVQSDSGCTFRFQTCQKH